MYEGHLKQLPDTEYREADRDLPATDRERPTYPRGRRPRAELARNGGGQEREPRECKRLGQIRDLIRVVRPG
jgi:hypothetical protein